MRWTLTGMRVSPGQKVDRGERIHLDICDERLENRDEIPGYQEVSLPLTPWPGTTKWCEFDSLSLLCMTAVSVFHTDMPTISYIQ